jgi:glutathione S-transferase
MNIANLQKKLDAGKDIRADELQAVELVHVCEALGRIAEAQERRLAVETRALALVERLLTRLERLDGRLDRMERRALPRLVPGYLDGDAPTLADAGARTGEEV